MGLRNNLLGLTIFLLLGAACTNDQLTMRRAHRRQLIAEAGGERLPNGILLAADEVIE